MIREAQDTVCKGIEGLMVWGSLRGTPGRGPAAVAASEGFCRTAGFGRRLGSMSLLSMVLWPLRLIELLRLPLPMSSPAPFPSLQLASAWLCTQRTHLHQLYTSIIAILRLMLQKVDLFKHCHS